MIKLDPNEERQLNTFTQAVRQYKKNMEEQQHGRKKSKEKR